MRLRLLAARRAMAVPLARGTRFSTSTTFVRPCPTRRQEPQCCSPRHEKKNSPHCNIASFVYLSFVPIRPHFQLTILASGGQWRRPRRPMGTKILQATATVVAANVYDEFASIEEMSVAAKGYAVHSQRGSHWQAMETTSRMRPASNSGSGSTL